MNNYISNKSFEKDFKRKIISQLKKFLCKKYFERGVEHWTPLRLPPGSDGVEKIEVLIIS